MRGGGAIVVPSEFLYLIGSTDKTLNECEGGSLGADALTDGGNAKAVS